ncbi:50S ribosomal protein L10 [archaeon]|nr:50S ribosomal protein L10 [archaeon]|tara:strand:+ start:878 stop:2140 length:1263 start_codon:yes stop_codon:yes gene_type:complete
MEKKRKIAKWKIEKLKELKKILEENDIIGIVNLESVPCLQLQRIKKQLKGKISLFMTKKRIMKRALEEVDKKNLSKFSEELKGVPALLFSKEEPFSLFNTLKKSKTKTAAKPGQVALNDIVINKGPTPFPPGPIIGELGSVGIIASVEEGKVVVQDDVVLVKEGEEISFEKADILSKLGVEPMEVGLNLTTVYNKGEILSKEVLDIDESEYVENIVKGYWDAINLGIDVGYVVKDNVEMLVSKGVMEGKALEESMPSVEDEVKKGAEEGEKLKEEVDKKEENLLEKDSAKEVKKEESKVEEEEKVLEKDSVKIEKKEEPKIEEKLKEEIKETVEEKPVEVPVKIEKKPDTDKLLKEAEEEIIKERLTVEPKKEEVKKNNDPFDARGPKVEVPKAEDLIKMKEEKKVEKKDKIDVEKLLER